MTATRQDITIECGADFGQPWFAVNPAGAPANLTGATAVMQIRLSPGDPAVLITLTTQDGSLVINGTAGSITPHIDEDATEALTPGIYVYDIKMLTADGKTSRPFQGTATVSAEVTTVQPPAPAVSSNPYLLLGVF